MGRLVNVKLHGVVHVGCVLVVAAVGCNQPEERFGRTWYLDGAGNWGFGVSETVYGLRDAGYKGQVSAFLWSMTMSPVADQVLKPLSGLGAARLAGCIDDYLRRHPGKEVNIIGLSAGAGVALNAVKHVTPPHKINNVILLSASVSCRYDVKPVIKNMRGKIYVYYSANDGMLAGPVRVLGSFGGKIGDEPAGLVGLHPPTRAERVVNVGWRPRFERYGWSGSHTSVTSMAFVRHVLSGHILSPETTTLAGTALARAGSPRSGSELAGRPSGNRPNAGESSAARTGRPRTKAAPVRVFKTPKPRPAVYARPPGDAVAAAVKTPLVRPGRPATFMTLSRCDPRFPACSQVSDGLGVRLIGVPSGKTARVEVCGDRRETSVVHDMAVETGQRCCGKGGRSWAVTLLSVDPASQTAWLQVRPVAHSSRGAARKRDKRTPASDADARQAAAGSSGRGGRLRTAVQ